MVIPQCSNLHERLLHGRSTKETILESYWAYFWFPQRLKTYFQEVTLYRRQYKVAERIATLGICILVLKQLMCVRWYIYDVLSDPSVHFMVSFDHL
jgi:hypothetical protein